MKDKSIAAILAFFFGGFGVHRFYLNQTGQGVAYLLFFWTAIPSIIAFFDFIGFLMYSEENFNRKYNPEQFISRNRYDRDRDELEQQLLAKEPPPAEASSDPYPDRRQAIRIHTENIRKGMEGKNYGQVNESYAKLLESLRQQNQNEPGKYDDLIAQTEEDYADFKKAFFSD